MFKIVLLGPYMVSLKTNKMPPHAANTSHSAIVVLMLGHRLRRWYNIKTMMDQCLMSVGTANAVIFCNKTVS